MRNGGTWVLAGAGVLAGLAGGYAIGRTGDSMPSSEARGRATAVANGGRDSPQPSFDPDDGPIRSRGETPRGRRSVERAAPERDEPREDAVEDEPDHDRAAAASLGRLLTTEDEIEIERLRREVAELREDRAELMGSAIEPDPDPAPRFTGPAMSSAVRDAMKTENVGGDIDATDCAEHPCIVFGRLEGDEEDMEEIERSPALAGYGDDVLTLLFWAVSVEDGTTAKAPETGLFALAFYSREDRQNRGDELDRRIRARVMEYWNTDRPGNRG